MSERYVSEDGVVTIEPSWFPGVRLERALQNNASPETIAELRAEFEEACIEEGIIQRQQQRETGNGSSSDTSRGGGTSDLAHPTERPKRP